MTGVAQLGSLLLCHRAAVQVSIEAASSSRGSNGEEMAPNALTLLEELILLCCDIHDSFILQSQSWKGEAGR